MFRPFLLTAVLTFALDQATKWYVVWHLGLYDRGQIDVFPPYLRFRMGWNEGINFGLLSDYPEVMRWILIALSVAVSLWLAIWSFRTRRGIVAVAAGLLAGGALGNALDRKLYGAVADFLNMSCCGISNPFAFNIADVAIFAGAIGLMLFAGGKKPASGRRRKKDA